MQMWVEMKRSARFDRLFHNKTMNGRRRLNQMMMTDENKTIEANFLGEYKWAEECVDTILHAEERKRNENFPL